MFIKEGVGLPGGEAKVSRVKAPLFIGAIELGAIPRIVAIIESLPDQEQLRYLQQQGVTLLEFRIDSFNEPLEEVVDFLAGLANSIFRSNAKSFSSKSFSAKRFSAKSALGLLATIRQNRYSRGGRLEMFDRLLPLVDCIDVEYESSEQQELFALARRHGKKVLLSVHNFDSTPPLEQMQHYVRESYRLEADLLKLAFFVQKSEELVRLLQFTHNCNFPFPVTIAMGPLGEIFRIVAPFFGSVLSYGYIDRPNATGQLSVTELHSRFYAYHPHYRQDYEARLGG